MSNAAKHRKKAAEFEQLRQTDRAIALYVRAIEESELAGEDVDVALLNKVGDLALRQGRVPDAITYYERAVEHYANSGLFNNAIALCNKILRNAPGRANVYFTLGRICARKGLRGDATRNFLEYATRMQQEERVDEGMRALAEVADLMPELTEVRRLVDDHADRAGIVLPRRRTPSSAAMALSEESPPSSYRDKSQDLIFLEVDYGAPVSRRTPAHSTRIPTPPSLAVISGRTAEASSTAPFPAPALDADTERSVSASLDAVMLFDPADAVDETASVVLAMDAGPADLPMLERLEGLEASGDFADGGAPPLEGLTLDEIELPALVVDPSVHTRDVTWVRDLDWLAEVHEERGFQPTGDQSAVSDSHQPLDDDVAEGFTHAAADPAVARVTHGDTPAHLPELAWIETEDVVDVPLAGAEVGALAEVESEADDEFEMMDEEPLRASELRAPFRIDPHDFILPGELPPLILGDELVEAGIAVLGSLAESASGEGDVLASEDATASDVVFDPDPLEEEVSTEAVLSAHASVSPGEALVGEGRPVMVTPSLPIAAVAAEATLVATSRRDTLRAAVAKLPQDWLLRRRLAEALFEAGERDAGLAELDAALQGLVGQGDLHAAADIADTLVQVAPERVAFHQKRVELSVRLQDQGRLRVAYLDLADALVRTGEENRARAVYARVLEIDPYDDRARAALGSAAPPLPTKLGSDANFVDLADWLRDDAAPASTRMRMREPVISGDEQADFDALLRHFKEGVARSLGEDDHESHYDLGVAFKEMGLLADAIEEFQKALRSRSHRLPAYEALGQCFVEQGRHQVATTVLSRALHEPGVDDEQRVGVLYLIAYSCEAMQRWDEARSYFQRVYATDIHFRDAAARLAALDQVAR